MALTVSNDFKEKTVIDGGGNVVGSVDELLIDPETWRVEGLRVKLLSEIADQLGEARGTFKAALIDVPIAAVGAAGQAVILTVQVGSLRQQQDATQSV